jgi:hypothetical protein
MRRFRKNPVKILARMRRRTIRALDDDEQDDEIIALWGTDADNQETPANNGPVR